MLLRFCHGCQSRRIKTMYGRFFLVLMPYLCCHDVLRWIFIVCLQFHSLIGCCVWSWHHAHCWHAAGTLSRVLCRFANRFRKIWRVTRYNQVLWPHTAPSVNRWIPPPLTRPHKLPSGFEKQICWAEHDPVRGKLLGSNVPFGCRFIFLYCSVL